MTDTIRRYLVTLYLGDANPDRLANIVPPLLAALGRLSSSPIEQAFHSSTRELFGYFIITKLMPRQIVAAIQSPARGSIQQGLDAKSMPFLNNRDALMVLELGDEFVAGEGFTRAGTWLQRNPKPN